MCGILVRVSTHPTTDSDEAFASGLHCRGPDGVQSATRCLPASVYVSLTASLLQLRGLGGGPVQPLRVSSSYGSLLAFNGEIFGGLPALDSSPHANDGSVLLEALCGCDDEGDVVALLGALRGPWALAFYCATTGTLWFGRDAFGRRSLLLAADNDKSSLLLSSLAPPKRSDVGWSTTWAELPPGVYSLRCCGGGGAAVRHHGFGGGWLASSLFPFSRRGVSAHALPSPPLSPAERVLAALSLAVARRVCGTAAAPLLVLFSGGLDSTLLALLAHAHAPPAATICLSSVCFSSGRSSDRAAALDAASELASLAPHRHWVLLPIDVTPEEDAASRPGVRGLIYPCSTAMDENIGTALLFAARAKAAPSTDGCGDDVAAAASARVALLGTGADELCGGYGRHRSAWGRGGAAAARAEMDADVSRLWIRNLGRDDRVVASTGREARHPFLDEDFVACICSLDLCDVTDFAQPPGIGDKAVLRDAARLAGLTRAAGRVKRAIQFGSGAAKAADARAGAGGGGGGRRRTGTTPVVEDG